MTEYNYNYDSAFYPWNRSLIAQQRFITDVNSFKEVVATKQGDYKLLLEDMRQGDNGYRIDTQKWHAALEEISDSNQAKMQEVTDDSIKTNSGDAYTSAFFGPERFSGNLSASRIDQLVEQYATLKPSPINWDKEDHVLEGLASMKTSFDNMQKIYDMFHDNVKSLSETEDSKKRA